MNDLNKLYIVLALVVVLWATYFHSGVERANAKADACAPFDAWIGGQPFDYRVDSQGNWNLPDDVEQTVTVTFPNAGLWKYYSPKENRSYVIVFLSFKATQPPGARLGQHDICVYELPGLGMGDS